MGLLRLPKNSTQNAGSKEKDEKEGEWGMDAPFAEDGMLKRRAEGWPFVGCAWTKEVAINREALATTAALVRMVVIDIFWTVESEGVRKPYPSDRSLIYVLYTTIMMLRRGLLCRAIEAFTSDPLLMQQDGTNNVFVRSESPHLTTYS